MNTHPALGVSGRWNLSSFDTLKWTISPMNMSWVCGRSLSIWREEKPHGKNSKLNPERLLGTQPMRHALVLQAPQGYRSSSGNVRVWFSRIWHCEQQRRWKFLTYFWTTHKHFKEVFVLSVRFLSCCKFSVLSSLDSLLISMTGGYSSSYRDDVWPSRTHYVLTVLSQLAGSSTS